MKNFNIVLYFIKFSTIIFAPSLLFANITSTNHWSNKAVLIKSYQQSFDWLNPWEKGEISTKNGMAIVVNTNSSKRKILTDKVKYNSLYLLTTAEIVVDATLIEVTRKDSLKPFTAKIFLIDYAANLALLKIDNFEFWKNLKPVIWENSKPFEKYKSTNIKTLKIKSIEEWHIQNSKLDQMTVGHRKQTNAWFPQMKLSGLTKVSPGFPVIQDNKTIGMILEYRSSEAKAVPTEMILEFFRHSKKKNYQSLAHRGFRWKKLPQKSTADYFKIPYEKPGIWISNVLPYGTGSEVLIKGDYLTKIGKWPISYEGKINHPIWGLSLFDLLFLDMLKVDDLVQLYVIRDGKPIILRTKVSSFKEIRKNVPLKKVGIPPRYIINGGFLFQELTLNYLSMWGKNWENRAPLRLRLFLEVNNSTKIPRKNKKRIIKNKDSKENFKSRVVLVTQVIPDQINIGYQKIRNAIVLKINNLEIKQLDDVRDAFLNPKGDFHRIDFLPGSNRLSVILPVSGLNDSNARIKNNFRIPKLQSL